MFGTLKLNDEPGRLLALHRYGILDSGADHNFDAITALVKDVLGVPIAAVSLIDEKRQWFKSMNGLESTETPRSLAFCDHSIRAGQPMLIEDSLTDPRFDRHPLVTGEPFIRSYAGAPLTTPDGYNLGALCAIDTKRRRFSPSRIVMLKRFAGLIAEQLELHTLAHRDFLTGALSRRAFTDCAEAALGQILRDDGSGALVLFDVDHFKRVNDRFGHPAGDRVLQAIAETGKSLVRPADLFGRLGGEEFGLFLNGSSSADAFACAERLRLAVSRLEVAGCGPVSVSCGIALARGGASFELLLAEADTALYVAKQSGRNRSVLSGELSVAA